MYLRQTPNELTGEHSCVMLRSLAANNNNDTGWLGAFARDFHKRFLSLLSYQFRTFPSVLALSINESATSGFKNLDAESAPRPLTSADLDELFSPFDLKRLDSYANNMLDYHVIIDMVPQIAFLHFTGRLAPAVSLTGVQQSILLAIGLQRKVLEDVEKELNLPVSQLLAMFVKIVRKVSSHFRALVAGTVAESMPTQVQEAGRANVDVDGGVEVKVAPKQKDLDDELREGGEEVGRELREKQRALIDALPLDRCVLSTPEE